MILRAFRSFQPKRRLRAINRLRSKLFRKRTIVAVLFVLVKWTGVALVQLIRQRTSTATRSRAPSNETTFNVVTYPLETLSVRYIVRSTTAKGLQRELESRYKRASWEIDDFAQKNKLLYGPINYEFVKYNHTSSESTSLVAWVPAVRDVNPLHIPQVRIMLSRPLNIIKDGIRIKEYGGEAV